MVDIGLLPENIEENMNIHLNFDKKTVSLGLFKYLATNMPDEADRKSISRK